MEKFFFWSYGAQIWGQKWTHTKIDHFTKNAPKSSILSIFHLYVYQNRQKKSKSLINFTQSLNYI
jgi:hypothetical protein